MILLDLLIPVTAAVSGLWLAWRIRRINRHVSPLVPTTVEALTADLEGAPGWVKLQARAWPKDALIQPATSREVNPRYLPLGPKNGLKPSAPSLYLYFDKSEEPADGEVLEITGTWTENGVGGEALSARLPLLKPQGSTSPAPGARALIHVRRGPEAWRREQIVLSCVVAATLTGIAVLTIALMPDWMRDWIEAPYWPF